MVSRIDSNKDEVRCCAEECGFQAQQRRVSIHCMKYMLITDGFKDCQLYVYISINQFTLYRIVHENFMEERGFQYT